MFGSEEKTDILSYIYFSTNAYFMETSNNLKF